MQKGIIQETKIKNYQKLSNNILITHSDIDTIPTGKVYLVFKQNSKHFIFNAFADKILLDNSKLQWKQLDKVVMIVKILSSKLSSIVEGKIYRIYNDAKNDERYLVDENGDKVLFDKNIFKCEIQ